MHGATIKLNTAIMVKTTDYYLAIRHSCIFIIKQCLTNKDEAIHIPGQKFQHRALYENTKGGTEVLISP
jgi:hypothetical protein